MNGTTYVLQPKQFHNMGSPTESILLAIAPKFTSFLSICGSLGIIVTILRSPRRRKKTMPRIMLGMSISDQLASIWYFAGTWVIPAGTLSRFGNGTTDTIFWAAGDKNGVTCSIGGFFNQFAVCTPLYNSTLALYYFLTVYFGWDDRRISRISWTFHVLPWSYALFTSIFAAATDLYGHVEWTCWILPDELFDDNKDPSPLQDEFRLFQWLFLFGVVWACTVFVTVIFVALYLKMKHREKKMKDYLTAYTGYTRHNSVAPKISEHTTEAHSKDKLSDNPEGNESSNNETSDNGVHSEDNVSDSYSDSDDDSMEGDEVPDIESGVEQYEENKISDPKGLEVPLPTIHEDISNRGSTTNAKDTDETNDIDEDAFGKHEKPDPRKKVGMSFRLTWLTSVYQPYSSKLSCAGKEIRREKKEEISPEYILKKKFKKNSKARKVAQQGMLYVAAFHITWLFPTISRITEIISGENYFVIQFFDTLLVPIQGFLNFCIYMRPRLMIYRKKNPELGFWICFRDTLLNTE